MANNMVNKLRDNLINLIPATRLLPNSSTMEKVISKAKVRVDLEMVVGWEREDRLLNPLIITANPANPNEILLWTHGPLYVNVPSMKLN